MVAVNVQLGPLIVPGQLFHPVEKELDVGFALRVTDDPLTMLVVLHDPELLVQLIPAGVEVTIPKPVPISFTVIVGYIWNVAVTVVAAFTVTAQLPVPLQPAPDQPVNTCPLDALAVRVTPVPLTSGVDAQTPPQEMPPTLDVTVPLP